MQKREQLELALKNYYLENYVLEEKLSFPDSVSFSFRRNSGTRHVTNDDDKKVVGLVFQL